LRGNILKFWLEHARDRENGGFFGQIDNDLVIRKDAPRGALLTSRILWTFSAAYRRYKDPAYLEMARWAYDDLLTRFWDKEKGGLYWSVSLKGAPLDARKIVYVQSFGIYGLAEFYRATGEQAPLDHAIQLYRLLEQKSHDRVNGGYLEEFARDWTVSRDRGRRRSAMGSKGQKSQNVHLHILEAYTNLLRVWPDVELRRNLREVVDVLQTRVLDEGNHHLRLFLDEDWTPRSDEISFGHDIEYSWLLVETAEMLGDEKLLSRAKAAAVEIARVTLEEGVDPDGGVLGEANPHGITSSFKEWWPQAEATVGFFNAYQLSGDERFFAASLRSWDFIERQLIDRKNGEWFMGVSRDGKTKPPLKVSFWKCPYHNGRACMEMIDRLARTPAP
jgi:mannobiose 2-epimerase